MVNLHSDKSPKHQNIDNRALRKVLMPDSVEVLLKTMFSDLKKVIHVLPSLYPDALSGHENMQDPRLFTRVGS